MNVIFHNILDALAWLALMIVLAFTAYELTSLFSHGAIPTISSYIIPWVKMNRALAGFLTCICIGAIAWMVWHFGIFAP